MIWNRNRLNGNPICCFLPICCKRQDSIPVSLDIKQFLRVWCIESMGTSVKLMICSKINPNFDGIPIADCLPRLKLAQIEGFIRISKSKTPSPETGFCYPSICFPFWLKVESNNRKSMKKWHTLYEKSSRCLIAVIAEGGKRMRRIGRVAMARCLMIDL